MTEKRYSYDPKQVAILKDGEFWLDGQIDTACNHSEICNELNQLSEENEQLSHDATVLIYSNQEYRKENEQLKTKNNAYLQDIEMFKEENTTLKLENQELHKLNQEYIDSLSDEKKETLSEMLNAILGDDGE